MTRFFDDWAVKLGALVVAILIWWVIKTAVENNEIEKGVIDSVPSSLPITGAT